jgi:hypothetical protein
MAKIYTGTADEQQELMRQEDALRASAPQERKAGFWDSFTQGIAGVLSNESGAGAVRAYQQGIEQKNLKNRNDLNAKLAELRERALKKAELDAHDANSSLSQQAQTQSTEDFYKFGQVVMKNHPELLQEWTPEQAQSYIGKRSLAELDQGQETRMGLLRGFVNDYAARKDKQAHERKLAEREDVKAGRIQTGQELSLNRDWRNHPITKSSNEMGLAYNKFNAAMKTANSGMKDLSSIYAFVKALDPNSVVREGEIALSREATPALNKLKDMVNKYGKEGSLIPPQTILQIKAQMDAIRAGQDISQLALDDQFRQQSMDFGFNPERVVTTRKEKAAGVNTVKTPSGFKLKIKGQP